MLSTASILIILQVIILDGVLSIDNAAALAAIAETLPKTEQAPLPLSLRKILGNQQREAALKAGILGAYLGRGVMLLLAGFIVYYGWLKLLAAAYLLYLCGVHFLHWSPLFNFNFTGLSSFWKTVIMIEIADLAFSLDNVAAVVALSSNILLVIIGVFIAILIMRFAAQLFMKLIELEPRLEHAAFLLIGAIAIELILKTFGIQIDTLLQFSISLIILLGTVVYGQWAQLLKNFTRS